MKKVLKWKPGKEDKQMPKNDRMKGTFPMSISFTGKLSLLFSWTFDLSFIQNIKKVGPRTATHTLESGTWNEFCCLPSHAPLCPTSLPFWASLVVVLPSDQQLASLAATKCKQMLLAWESFQSTSTTPTASHIVTSLALLCFSCPH